MALENQLQGGNLDDEEEESEVEENEDAFNHAVVLFFEKWEKNPTLSKFLEHFKKEWIDKNNGWYEGFTDGYIPSPDNGLESVNGVIKRNHTLRERMTVPQYLTNAFKIITLCLYFGSIFRFQTFLILFLDFHFQFLKMVL